MTLTYPELLDRWNSDLGKPYKGRLIDFDAYNKDPTDPGCMCAQGQVLHELGGWTPDRLREVRQYAADKATAKLLNISITHAILLRQTNDTADGAPAIVLTDPGKVLGDQWSKILDFWSYLDGMTEAARAATGAAAWEVTREAAWEASLTAAWEASLTAAWAAAWEAASDAAWAAAGGASSEIQGAAILRRDGKPFFFLPMFGFASPDDIPARPANYGVPSVPH